MSDLEIDFDPESYNSMQEYASTIFESDELVDPLINRLAKGLMAGVHESSSEEIFDKHTTVRCGEDKALHYEDETGRWRDFT